MFHTLHAPLSIFVELITKLKHFFGAVLFFLILISLSREGQRSNLRLSKQLYLFLYTSYFKINDVAKLYQIKYINAQM